MFRSKTPNVTISIPQKALEAVFDECDRFHADETGGRIIGTYSKSGKEYQIDVLGVIGPGPNAQRSPTSFFHDGDYQERVFRAVEKEYPNVEHLGNWHTHHPNGLDTLSPGDRATYQRIVNHDKHNTDFLYALLVVRKTPNQHRRYEIKHYMVFRNDDRVHEIPESQILVLDRSRVGPSTGKVVFDAGGCSTEVQLPRGANHERVKDQEFFSDFLPTFAPGFSKSLRTLYWKGTFPLLDGSQAEVLAMETSDDGGATYAITVTGATKLVSQVVEKYKERTFKSARHAVWDLRRDIDSALYLAKKR